ncbi:hypothetical protein P3S67_029113 [Capsicum chacoense]
MLYNVPSVAIFHLKKFQNDGFIVRKVDKHVSFLMELDVLLYTYNNQTNNEQIKYDLYAVIVHAGSTSSLGHYYCFICAEPNEWFKFDDSMIVDNELKKTVQTSTPGPPSAINSSKENNASQDVGVIERMQPFLPKSSSRSQSTLVQFSSKNQWQMDPEQETEIMQACSMIKKRVSGPRGEEIMAALRRLGYRGSSLNAKRRISIFLLRETSIFCLFSFRELPRLSA